MVYSRYLFISCPHPSLSIYDRYSPSYPHVPPVIVARHCCRQVSSEYLSVTGIPHYITMTRPTWLRAGIRSVSICNRYSPSYRHDPAALLGAGIRSVSMTGIPLHIIITHPPLLRAGIRSVSMTGIPRHMVITHPPLLRAGIRSVCMTGIPRHIIITHP